MAARATAGAGGPAAPPALPAPSVTKKDLTSDQSGIFLYTTRVHDPPGLRYEVEVGKVVALSFTIDFTGSSNVRLVGSPTLTQTTELHPFERKTVAELVVVDRTQGWSTRTKFKWREGKPDPDTLRKFASVTDTEIRAALDRAASFKFGLDSDTDADVAHKCQANRTKYIDVEFPPTPESLYADPSTAASKDEVVTWRRASDFLQPGFALFESGIAPSDIRQGSLGDCWLMCSLAALTEDPARVSALFYLRDGTLQPMQNEYGFYTVRLCIAGEWTWFRMDDYFPCAPRSGPVYSKAHGNELWVMLIEKAFAKANGCYEALGAGQAFEALMDLTGCPSTKIRLGAEETQAMIKSGELFGKLRDYDASQYLMSCSTPGEDVFTTTGTLPEGGPGLVNGHAYTLLQVRETSSGEKLVEIRNPWGSFEWNGDWSDNSTKWTPQLKAELSFSEADDGKFWMSFDDFLRYFESVNVCRLYPGVGKSLLGSGPGKWLEARRKGTFRHADGIIESTMYLLNIPEKTSCWISIHQSDERALHSKPYLDLGVSVLRHKKGGGHELVAASGIEVDRQIQLEAQLEPGEYIIVPVTTGCKFAEVAKTAKSSAVPILTADGRFTPACESALRELFRRLDEDMDGVLDRDELSLFMQIVEGRDIDEGAFQWVIRTFDSNRSGLTADGFVDIYAYILKSSGNNPAVIWKDLIYMGYTPSLDLIGARTFVLSVHAECQPTLSKIPFSLELFEDAVELPVVQLGERSEHFDGAITKYTLKSGYWGMSIAVRNNTASPLLVDMSCDGSENLVSHTGSLSNECLIEPEEVEVMHHLVPATTGAWKLTSKMQMRPPP